MSDERGMVRLPLPEGVPHERWLMLTKQEIACHILAAVVLAMEHAGILGKEYRLIVRPEGAVLAPAAEGIPGLPLIPAEPERVFEILNEYGIDCAPDIPPDGLH